MLQWPIILVIFISLKSFLVAKRKTYCKWCISYCTCNCVIFQNMHPNISRNTHNLSIFHVISSLKKTFFHVRPRSGGQASGNCGIALWEVIRTLCTQQQVTIAVYHLYYLYIRLYFYITPHTSIYINSTLNVAYLLERVMEEPCYCEEARTWEQCSSAQRRRGLYCDVTGCVTLAHDDL